MQVVAPPHASSTVHVVRRSREDTLPGPFAARVRILPGQRVGKGRLAEARGEVGLVLLSHLSQVVPQRLNQRLREHGHAIPAALPARTVISRRSKSRSLTRKPRPSSSLTPDP